MAQPVDPLERLQMALRPDASPEEMVCALLRLHINAVLQPMALAELELVARAIVQIVTESSRS